MNTIETALAASGIPIQGQACLAAISRGELGGFFNSPNGFFILYGGGVWAGPTDRFPPPSEWPGSMGPGGLPTHAALFLQWEPATYAECAAATTLADISPASQIVNGWWLAQHVAPNLLALLMAGQLTEAASLLIGTWPAGGDSNFPGFYASELAILQAGAPPPPPAAETITITNAPDNAGGFWSGVLTKTATHMVAATIGLGAGTYMALPPAAEVPVPIPTPIAIPAPPPRAAPDYVVEWEACCRAMAEATLGRYHC